MIQCGHLKPDTWQWWWWWLQWLQWLWCDEESNGMAYVTVLTASNCTTAQWCKTWNNDLGQDCYCCNPPFTVCAVVQCYAMESSLCTGPLSLAGAVQRPAGPLYSAHCTVTATPKLNTRKHQDVLYPCQQVYFLTLILPPVLLLIHLPICFFVH